MANSRENRIDVPGPEQVLVKFLVDNYYNNAYDNFNFGHQERMADINKLLASDGGHVTIEAAIELIDARLDTSKMKFAEMKAVHKADKKKHPFRSLFSTEYEMQKNKQSTYHSCLTIIRDELLSAIKLKSVIDQSRFNKSLQ